MQICHAYSLLFPRGSSCGYCSHSLSFLWIIFCMKITDVYHSLLCSLSEQVNGDFGCKHPPSFPIPQICAVRFSFICSSIQALCDTSTFRLPLVPISNVQLNCVILNSRLLSALSELRFPRLRVRTRGLWIGLIRCPSQSSFYAFPASLTKCSKLVVVWQLALFCRIIR